MKLALVPSIALLAAGAAAQCCPTANLGCTTGFSNGNTNVFALIMQPCTTTLLIRGLTIKTQSTGGSQTIKFHVHLADSQTPPRPIITPARSGTIVVGPAYGLYSGILTAPLVLTPNTQWFISWETSGMRHPICTSGGTTPTSYWWHPPSATTWNGTFTQNWAYRVETSSCPPLASYTTYGAGCAGSNGTPTLTNNGLPKLGQSFQIDLANARANAPALVTLGVSDTVFGPIPLPFDLTILGAPGCKLLASPETLIGVLTSASGTASLTVPIPNIPALNNVSLFNQFMISDPTINKLTLVFSNGGKMTMGG